MAAKRSARQPKRRQGKGSGWFTGNNLVVMLFRLFIVLGLFFLSRIVFYLLNFDYFSGTGFYELVRIMIIGLRFDVSALLIINAPYIVMNTIPFRFRSKSVWQGTANGIFFVVNSVALMTNLIDTIYFRYTLKRMTGDILSFLGVGGDLDRLVPQFLSDFWYIPVLWIGCIALMVWLFTRFHVVSGGSKQAPAAFFIINLLFFLFFMGAAVIGIRGGLQLKPISIVTAGTHTTARNMPLILNTPFTIAKTIGEKPLKTLQYYKSEEELARVYSPMHSEKGNIERKENVVIIILESVSREHIGRVNRDLENGRYQGYTPFLDSLIGQGYYFDAFANGKTSIQGVPAILSAVPSLMNESIIQSGYAATGFTSIAGLLKPKGYESAFFHGGTNGTMGFDAYTRMTGFDRYYGRTEYNNEKDYDGKWGIRDEEFLQYSARTIKQLKQPFVAALFTLSSHHPYYVPPKYQNVFRRGKLPIQQSIMYTDHSLARFFYTARHMPWFRNTLFVITADHSSESYYPYYHTPVGQYAIPLLFYKPGSDFTGVSNVLAQQTDIMPTILNYLGYNGNFIAFGNDLFESGTKPRFSVHFLSGIYGLIKDGYYLENDGVNTTALYDLAKDPMQQVNILGKAGKVQQELEHFLRAYLQQYNNRVIENRLKAD